jgi:uncharacterized protein YdcH (DUF465 family)
MTINKLEQRKKSLEIKHRALDKSIEQAYIKRVNDADVQQMKVQKLQLKEKITVLERQIAEENNAA